jgi:hypothetical protein
VEEEQGLITNFDIKGGLSLRTGGTVNIRAINVAQDIELCRRSFQV